MIVAESTKSIFYYKGQSIVCPVNTAGVMGAGLALQFKERYPDFFIAYKKACKTDIFLKKGLWIYTFDSGKKIVCIPTKRHWKFKSQINWIYQALHILSLEYEDYGITDIGIPPIGCGLGGLAWDEVYPLIKQLLNAIDLPVTIYLP
jgi:O-acetyl-ADP-ribose deacetylase (regulator of RNase III)